MIIYLLFRIKKILIGSESRNFVKYEVEKKKNECIMYIFIRLLIFEYRCFQPLCRHMQIRVENYTKGTIRK